jgi:Zn-dependent protease
MPPSCTNVVFRFHRRFSFHSWVPQLPRDAWEDAVIAAGGPVLGSLGAGVVALGAAATDSQLLYALADFGFMINLFNMMPIGSMDGGRIAGALSPYASLAGIGMGGFLAYQGVVQNPLFYLILLAGGYDVSVHDCRRYYSRCRRVMCACAVGMYKVWYPLTLFRIHFNCFNNKKTDIHEILRSLRHEATQLLQNHSSPTNG